MSNKLLNIYEDLEYFKPDEINIILKPSQIILTEEFINTWIFYKPNWATIAYSKRHHTIILQFQILSLYDLCAINYNNEDSEAKIFIGNIFKKIKFIEEITTSGKYANIKKYDDLDFFCISINNFQPIK